jgi:UDP-N-acetylglucosamine 3-dehydrogenase
MIRAAVVGVGSMGRHHARVYAELDGVELVAIADPDDRHRAAATKRTGARAYESYQQLFDQEKLDVVSVAVPTSLHHEVVVCAFDHGVHVLVEKPIAASVEDATDLIRRRERNGLTLAVGHIERHNPAIIELSRRLKVGELGRIFQVHSRRMSTFPPYVRDVGVTLDLATHEIDVIRALVASPVLRMFAETSRNVHETQEDSLVSTLRFRNGVVGSLIANWVTPSKTRECRVFGERGMAMVDYLSQDLFFHENSDAPSRWDAMALFKGVEEGNVVKLRVAKAEPLRAELMDFVQAARAGTPPRVTGTDGLFAVAIAQMLLESAGTHRSLDVRDEVIRRGWPEVLRTGLDG